MRVLTGAAVVLPLTAVVVAGCVAVAPSIEPSPGSANDPSASAPVTPLASPKPTPDSQASSPAPERPRPTPLATGSGPAEGSVAGDDVADAVVISSIPFSQRMRTRRATTSASDPRCDSKLKRTVWFAYTAPVSGLLGATTEGSRYDTGLVVLERRSDGSLITLDCNDGAPVICLDVCPSAVRFSAQAGVEYLFMVGSSGRRGGRLTFNLDVAPAPGSVAVTVDSHGIVDTEGTVLISGTITCTGALDYTFVSVALRQRVDDVSIAGSTFDDAECSPAGDRWTIYVPADDEKFRAGPATVRVDVDGSDGFASYSSSSRKQPVSLEPIEPGATPFEPTEGPVF